MLSIVARSRIRWFTAISQRGFRFSSVKRESAPIPVAENGTSSSSLDSCPHSTAESNVEKFIPSENSSPPSPPYIPMPSKKDVSEEQLARAKTQIQETIKLFRTDPFNINTPKQIGPLLQICRRAGLKTEAFTLLDHAFSAGDKFEWIEDVVNAAVAFLCDEDKVMEAVTFLRGRELKYIKSLAFEPIIISLILNVKNTELMQIRMFAENIAVRLTARSHEAILRKYAHEGRDEPAERALLLMHTQGKVEILATELVKKTFDSVFPAGYETVLLDSEGDSTVDSLVVCPRCGMKVFTSKEYPCMQFERKFNRRMWHIPFCENPKDESQDVTWACCVPPSTSTY